MIGRLIIRSVGFTLILLSSQCFAAAPTSELQRAVRSATFEVVTTKQTQDLLSYEKPLPIELIPFTERNDKYWSVGTAFAIDHDSFVSAAHVLLASIGSRLGAPALRDAAGNVYPIDRILKFSLHEDFVVFSVKPIPNTTPLPVNREPHLDDGVFAVGNALGDGIVIRDGLYTSDTAEDQDGRWKWIRFSAAASPGNSGGPLLDQSGQVIGIVIAKSNNENLNFALPISRVLDASSKQASIDMRWLQNATLINATNTASWKESFSLPKSYDDFAKTYINAWHAAHHKAREQLESSQSQNIFPFGRGSDKLLAMVAQARFPQLISQRNDDSWGLQSAEDIETTELKDEGFVSSGNLVGVTLLQLRNPGYDFDRQFYRDSKASMDVLLKAMRIWRPVGPDRVRVTSLGKARDDSDWTDKHGRHWQVRQWPLDYANSTVVALMLPTPNGYIAMVDTVKSGAEAFAIDEMHWLANFMHLNYGGTQKQWRAFITDKELRPDTFDHIKLNVDATRGLQYESLRISFSIPPNVIDNNERNYLVLRTTFLLEDQKLVLDVGGIDFVDATHQNIFVSAVRHSKPNESLGTERTQEWQRMRDRLPPYNGTPRPNPDRKSYWIESIVDAASLNAGSNTTKRANINILYDVTYSTDADVMPRDLEERQRMVLRSMRIFER